MGAPGSRLLLCSLFAGALSFRSAQDLADLYVALAAPWDSPARQRQLGAFDSFGAPEVEEALREEDGSGLIAYLFEELIAYLFEELIKKCQAANASKLGEVCAQADAEGLVAKISEKLASADPEVAGWLCKAESAIIDAEKFRQGCSTASQSLMTGIKELLADKMNWKVLGKFAAYTAQAVAAVVPLPPPLAAVLEKRSDAV
ncbi:hypothetical protein AK812_SmicGene40326 [Symbiodinium microadriaticum]|uniref:Uncharacterized protein n=1 Tax=Symbiodinium microadriaticum TaxID=2951 RepID=A0A1Q9C8Z5_SYMMI|nr:hypothetical protein AK812_SmicGene40326 [Symbiodinium microadriaticum]